jgi:hypothetical protein
MASARLAAINDAMAPAYHTLRLLIAEKAPQYEAYSLLADSLFTGANTEPGAAPRIDQLSDAAIEVLQRERAAAAEDPGVWREVWTSLGLGLVAWPWSGRFTQGGRDLP